MAKESSQEALIRWKKLELLQSHYSSFNVFLEEAMSHLGFGVTEIQADIGNFLQYGPHYLMIQAQRSQAKTTITACFAVWALIHEPVLVFLLCLLVVRRPMKSAHLSSD